MFRFPLQRLLELKAAREQEMARQLADARRGADAERRTRDALAAVHAEAQRSLSLTASATPTVGELAALSYTLVQLSERISMAEERTSAAEAVADEKHQLLATALQERQVLDRLRERRLESHRDEERARDRVTMDAIALARFTPPAEDAGDPQDTNS